MRLTIPPTSIDLDLSAPLLVEQPTARAGPLSEWDLRRWAAETATKLNDQGDFRHHEPPPPAQPITMVMPLDNGWAFARDWWGNVVSLRFDMGDRQILSLLNIWPGSGHGCARFVLMHPYREPPVAP